MCCLPSRSGIQTINRHVDKTTGRSWEYDKQIKMDTIWISFPRSVTPIFQAFDMTTEQYPYWQNTPVVHIFRYWTAMCVESGEPSSVFGWLNIYRSKYDFSPYRLGHHIVTHIMTYGDTSCRSDCHVDMENIIYLLFSSN